MSLKEERGVYIKEELDEDDVQRILKMSEISVWIDNYDDIFSDFDSRPYHERALSDDFLQEIKRACRSKPSGGIDLKFLIPAHERNFVHETLIKKRLKEHFQKHFFEEKKEVKKIKKRGVGFVILGAFILTLATLSRAGYILGEGLFKSILITLTEPAGWFLLWEGSNQFLYEVRDESKSLDFYDKMSKANIHFMTYEYSRKSRVGVR